MIYETRNRRLVLNKKRQVELTEKEHKFLIALSNNKFTSLKDIAKYIYGNSDICIEDCIRIIKSRLCKKTDIKIITRYKGYILKDKIFFK